MCLSNKCYKAPFFGYLPLQKKNMKKINSIMIAMILVFSVSQFNVFAQDKQETKKTTSKKEIYTCPMHSDVVSDKPGTCSKCKMDLEKKGSDKKDHMMAMMGNPFFEKSVDGLKFQVWIQTQDEHKKHMSENMGKMMGKHMMEGMDGSTMSKMMSGTHHVALKITNEKNGKEVGTTVEMQSVSPTQKSAAITMIKRHKHFGNGISLDEKGKYQLTAIVTLKDKKSSKVQFNYEVK